jgi:hypothetical protein
MSYEWRTAELLDRMEPTGEKKVGKTSEFTEVWLRDNM